MNRFEYKTYNTNMEIEVELTRALESVVRWKNYAEDLKKERDGWIDECRSARADIARLVEDRKKLIEQNASLSLKLSLAKRDNDNINDGKNGYNPGHWSV